jgi:hypothetical protein
MRESPRIGVGSRLLDEGDKLRHEPFGRLSNPKGAR